MKVRVAVPAEGRERRRPSRADSLAADIERARRGTSAALPDEFRRQMEARFGADFSRVRIHADGHAAATARSLGARAFTLGDEIFFAGGLYNPDSVDGRRLLAHELAHVLQSPLHEHASEPVRAADLEGDAGRERHASEAAARAESGRPLDRGTLASRNRGEPRLARFVDSLPSDRAVVPLANPFVEQFSLDVARALQLDPDDHGGHTRRRLRRLDEQTRAAIVGRAQELLPPALRERCAVALTAAATDHAERETTQPLESPTSAPEPTRASEPTATAAAETTAAEQGAEASTPVSTESQAVQAAATAAAEQTAEAAAPAPTEAQAPTHAGKEQQPKPGPGHVPATPRSGPEAVGVQAATAAATQAQEPTGEARATAAAPGPPEAATPGAAAVETSAAAAAGISEGGDAGAQADLGPMSELENRVEARDRQHLEAAEHEVNSAHAEASDGAPAAAPEPETAAEPTSTPSPTAGPAPSEPRPAAGPGPAVEPQQPTEPEPDAEREPAAEPEADTTPEPQEAEPTQPESTHAEPEPPASPAALEPTAAAAPAEAPASRAAPHEEVHPGLQPEPAVVEAEPPTEPQATSDPAAAEGPTENGTAEAAPPEPESAPPNATDAAPEAGGAEPEAAGHGDCGPDTSGGPGVGGGGGAPIEDQPEQPVPDTAQADPVEAMGSVSNLPPQQLGSALGGVGAAANRDVGAQRQELAAAPPSLERPSGAPQTRPAGAPAPGAAATQGQAAARAERLPTGSAAPRSAPVTLPEAPPSPTRAVASPSISGGAQTQVTAEQAQAIRNAVDELPTHDPGLEITADPAPTLELSGAADPQHVSDQRAELDRTTQSAQEEGARDVATPLGEHEVYPTVPHETLHAELPNSAPAPASAGTAPAPAGAQAPAAASSAAPQAGPVSATDDAVGIVARERDSDTVQAAALQGRAQMVAGRDQHETDVSTAQETSRNDVAQLEQSNSDEQTRRRNETLAEVHQQRTNWSRDQQNAVTDSRRDADEQHDRVEREVTRPHVEAEQAAVHEIEKGNRDAATERRKGEENAARERQKGREESSGVLGWLADRARSFFNRIRNAIKAAFDAARALVRRAIDAAKRLANDVIDAARRAIVSAIRSIGERLAQIGDVLLAAFPTLRDRFRRAITRVVDAAVAEVNRLADALKEGIQRALNVLGAALDAALGLLERAYLAAVDAVASVVTGVINAARAIVSALATWAALIRDIASNPVQWIRNLGASASDGIRNHLWRALKCAVKEWFNSKVEEVLGLPLALFNLLRSGGIRLAEIGHMVWEGLKAAIPGILIQLAIEKIVAMIIPAAGAIMAIIEALQAAWGTIQRILSAFERFFAFLRAVKGGRAGPQFATMIAAAAVVVLDFLANFLVRRLMRPARPVAGRLAALGRRIMARLSGAVRAVGRGLRRVAQAVRRGAQRAAAIVRRAAGAVRNAAGRVTGTLRRGATRALAAVRRVGGRVLGVVERRLPRVAAMMRRVGGAARRLGAGASRAYRRGRAWLQRQRQRFRRWREERRRHAMERARRELPTRIQSMLARGVSRARLWLTLRAWKAWYGLRVLTTRPDGEGSKVVAANSPDEDLVTGIIQTRGRILEDMFQRVGEDILRDPEVNRLADEIMAQRRQGAGTAERPLILPAGYGGAPAARDIQQLSILGGPPPGSPRAIPSTPEMEAAMRVGLRTGAPAPGLEFFQVAPGVSPLAREAPLFGGHAPLQIKVGGVQTYQSELHRVAPSNPAAFWSSVFHLQSGEVPPSAAWNALSTAEREHAVHTSRLSQVEQGRAVSAVASERLGTALAATPAAGTGRPLRTHEQRLHYRHQPATGRGAPERAARAAMARGFEPTPGVPLVTAPTQRSIERGEVHRFIQMHLNLAKDWLRLQIMADPNYFNSLARAEQYVDLHMRGHLRSVLFAERASIGSTVFRP